MGPCAHTPLRVWGSPPPLRQVGQEHSSVRVSIRVRRGSPLASTRPACTHAHSHRTTICFVWHRSCPRTWSGRPYCGTSYPACHGVCSAHAPPYFFVDVGRLWLPLAMHTPATLVMDLAPQVRWPRPLCRSSSQFTAHSSRRRAGCNCAQPMTANVTDDGKPTLAALHAILSCTHRYITAMNAEASTAAHVARLFDSFLIPF